MAKFLITLRLTSSLQGMHEAHDRETAFQVANILADKTEEILLQFGWEKPINIDTFGVEEIKNGN